VYNPQRKKGRTPKLQSNWEGPYRIVKKLSDVIFMIQKSARHRLKVVNADRLAPFEEKEKRLNFLLKRVEKEKMNKENLTEKCFFLL